MKEIKKYKLCNLLLLLVVMLASAFEILTISTNAQDVSNCIVCAQSIPDCGTDKEFVPQTCEQCAHCKPLPISISTSSSGGSNCAVPCGNRCCKGSRICVTIDKCKDRTHCIKPLIYKCKRPKQIN